jgi:SAM-dependent methyltransferase
MESEFKLKENSLLKIPLPRGDRGIQKIKRHFLQLFKIFFSPDYANYNKMFELGKRNYESNHGASFWKEIATNGLETYEEEALRSLSNEYRKVLVYGCGAGREAFGIGKLDKNVDAYDYSRPLIDFAKKMNSFQNVHFYHELPDKKYDVIFVTNVLMNLIPGSKKRDEFLQEIKKRCHEKTECLFFINEGVITYNSRFFWLSLLLKVKSYMFLGPWEKGDIVSSWMANRTQDPTPLYYHFFTEVEITEVFRKNGLKASRKWGIFWKVCLDTE